MCRQVLLKCVLTALSWAIVLGSVITANAQDTAGRVDFAIGGVTATVGSGVPRPLAKGSLVFSGDTINTDSTGRAQIRFTDGAYMSLQPQTQFRVDDYRFEGATNGQEKGFFSLLKGGLRTITGAIGHTNRDTYQVHTPVATVGIRGTEYLVNLVNGLEVSVGQGSIFLVNQAGKFVLEQGQSGFVANQNSKMIFTNSPPSMPPAQKGASADVPTFVAGNQTNANGTSAIIGSGFGALPFGPGYAMSVSAGYASTVNFGQCAGLICGMPIVTLSANGVSWTETNLVGVPPGFLFQQGLNTVAQGSALFNGGSAGGVIGWGSFTNGTIITTDTVNGTLVRNFGANEGVHFVLGLPTSPMPTTGVANMNLIGATRPTFSDNLGGGLGTGTVTSGTVNANFGTNTVSTTLNMSFSSGNSFSASAVTATNGVPGYGPGSPGFVVVGTFINTNRLAAICATGCSFIGGGFFAGPGATYAGYSYIAGTPTFTIHGAAAFH